MGTDIHFFVEKKVGDKWVTLDEWKSEDHSAWAGGTYYSPKTELYGSRNYDTFAILADVRNGYGFAGVDTGEGFVPISAPKGYPDDMCKELKSHVYDDDYHSESWLTLKELLDYNWNRTTKQRIFIHGQDWDRWKNEWSLDPEKKGLCGFGGGGPDKISNEEMDKLPQEQRDNFATLVEYEEDYTSAAHEFYHETIPKLKEMCDNHTGNPEDIRIVFAFDS